MTSPAARVETMPVLLLDGDSAALVPGNQEVRITLGRDEAARYLADGGLLVCHARQLARRLCPAGEVVAFDVLELFAFVCPASFVIPTPGGLAALFDLPIPVGAEAEAKVLRRVVTILLGLLAGCNEDRRPDLVAIAMVMGGAMASQQLVPGVVPVAGASWPWAPLVLAALGGARARKSSTVALNIWDRLPRWAEHAPQPPPGHISVSPEEARQRLAILAGTIGSGAEPRPQQAEYAAAVASVFVPRAAPGEPHVLIAEAGTGVGKTLGYLAPATLWAEQNDGSVWVSTFTRNLQNQIDGELDRLWPNREEKERQVVVRKGRENYLCLLNLEEAAGGLAMRPHLATALGLVARWAAVSRDGDMQGGDLPGWMPDLLGAAGTLSLTDRRGECVHGGCPHYHRCFIERSVRKARRARIVIANHALVAVQAALGGDEENKLPSRYIFDEGHHLFDAADSVFSSHLTGQETAALRRWILGAEGRSGRARGLRRRLADLLEEDEEGQRLLGLLEAAARDLPSEGWAGRLLTSGQQVALSGLVPMGPAEAFLAQVRLVVVARCQAEHTQYNLETDPRPLVDGMSDLSRALDQALECMQIPMAQLAHRLDLRLGEEAAELDTDSRRRIEALSRSLQRRAQDILATWRRMLASLEKTADAGMVDLFLIERVDGREVDVGFHRHWIDPTIPFIQAIRPVAHSIAMTSATLTDATGEVEANWLAAEQRTGTVHFSVRPERVAIMSPFDYSALTQVLIVTDVQNTNLDHMAAAFRELFLASGGGALGLFTAISRLRAVYARIASPLDRAGLKILAQHLDGIDVATLIDMFRATPDACLLGTDAVRDGVDVPGRSLRLMVVDRVPWPRPDFLHRARRKVFGGAAYDDRLTRLRLRQAFGRLVRRADDQGVFVILDRRMPSRLLSAFPPGVPVVRTGLAEAVAMTKRFLQPWLA